MRTLRKVLDDCARARAYATLLGAGFVDQNSHRWLNVHGGEEYMGCYVRVFTLCAGLEFCCVVVVVMF